MIDIDLEGKGIGALVLMVESILVYLVEGRKLEDKSLEEVCGDDRNLMHPRIHRLILRRQDYLGRLRCHGEECYVLARHEEGNREGGYAVPVHEDE